MYKLWGSATIVIIEGSGATIVILSGAPVVIYGHNIHLWYQNMNIKPINTPNMTSIGLYMDLHSLLDKKSYVYSLLSAAFHRLVNSVQPKNTGQVL